MNTTGLLNDPAFDPESFPAPKIPNGRLMVIRINGIDTLCKMHDEQWIGVSTNEPIPKDAKVEVIPQEYSADRNDV